MNLPFASSVVSECETATTRLTRAYDWQLDSVPDFAKSVAGKLSARIEGRRGDIDKKLVERACLAEYFAKLYDELRSGEASRHERAIRQLFDLPQSDEESDDLPASGYLVKAALRQVNSWRRKFDSKLTEETVRELAMDSASDALSSIVTNLRQCHDRETFWGWATRIVENAVVDGLRRLRRHQGSAKELVDEGSEPDPAGKIVDQAAVLHEFVRKCRIGKLSPEQRVTIFKCFWEDATVSEIARHISGQLNKSVSPGNVSVWKTRGLRVLANNLSEHGFR